MNLKELVNLSEKDFDTYDTEYDACVTVCYIGEDSDDYDKFCNAIMEKVNVVKGGYDSTLIVDWSELVKRNMEKFKKFTNENWYKACQYEDDEDEFIYQWIEEINRYMAGYVAEDFYKELVEFVESLV